MLRVHETQKVESVPQGRAYAPHACGTWKLPQSVLVAAAGDCVERLEASPPAWIRCALIACASTFASAALGDILAQARNSQAVQPHAIKCFDCIKALRHLEECRALVRARSCSSGVRPTARPACRLAVYQQVLSKSMRRSGPAVAEAPFAVVGHAISCVVTHFTASLVVLAQRRWKV